MPRAISFYIHRDTHFSYRVMIGRRQFFGWICQFATPPGETAPRMHIVDIRPTDISETHAPTFRQMFAQLERLSVTYTNPSGLGLK